MAWTAPWKTMTDDELVARCRQRPAEAAWVRFGERYGVHLVAGAFVAWFAFANRPIPWYGYFALVCLYFFLGFLAYLFVFLLPAGIRVVPYARELDRRHSILSFPREVRRARQLFRDPDPPDWIILFHSEGIGMGWSWNRLTLHKSPPRGRHEHRSGTGFGILTDPTFNPMDHLVRRDRPLGEEECRSAMETLHEIDLKRVVDVDLNAFDIPYSRLAVLRRDPPATRKARFSPVGVVFDPETRRHPTYRVAALSIELPKESPIVKPREERTD